MAKATALSMYLITSKIQGKTESDPIFSGGCKELQTSTQKPWQLSDGEKNKKCNMLKHWILGLMKQVKVLMQSHQGHNYQINVQVERF